MAGCSVCKSRRRRAATDLAGRSRSARGGGNQSWSGVAKLLDPSRFDYLFVLVGDGRQWFVPADRIEGVRGVLMGGPKYAEFEVDRGDRIPGCIVDETVSTIAS